MKFPYTPIEEKNMNPRLSEEDIEMMLHSDEEYEEEKEREWIARCEWEEARIREEEENEKC